jgi:sulfur-carrier protein adenylyltransferase/sulfurtransferase
MHSHEESMAVVIHIPTVLRRFTDQRDTVKVGGQNVREALLELAQQYPPLVKHLYDNEGRLRSFVNVYLGEHDVRHLELKQETALKDGDALTIVPSIAGGTDAPDFSREEIRRYSRHLILPEVGMEGQRKLKAASVLVIGAGGLGSPLLAYLAAAGVGRIGIVDADVVDESNLQRQIIHGVGQVGIPKLESARAFIANLNPQVKVDLWNVFFSGDNAAEIARSYDILVDGTDNFPTRYLVNDIAFLLGKPNVYGSIYRFEGQASVFCTHDGPCYRCLYPEPPPPGLVPSCAEGGVLGVLPGIVGSIQANEVIKLILGIGNTLSGRLLRFDALQMSFREFQLKRDPECPLCGEHPTITAPIDYYQFCGVPIGEATVQVPEEFSLSPLELHDRLRNGNGHTPRVVDVRNAEELAICQLDGAQPIPLAELDFRLHELTREQDIVLLCHTGIRSARAWHLLRAAGFERVYNLEGGIQGWAEDVDSTMAIY